MLNCINEILRAYNSGINLEKVGVFLEELTSMTRAHFERENNLIDGHTRIGTNHIKEHERALDNLSAISKNVRTTASDDRMLEEYILTLIDWFIKHTIQFDAHIKTHFKHRTY
jgi:hemerythrin-like metal-binding protein